jgi:hypothetical protein
MHRNNFSRRRIAFCAILVTSISQRMRTIQGTSWILSHCATKEERAEGDIHHQAERA